MTPEAYLGATAERRRFLCDEAQARLGLPASSIEKDFWVCWVLRELFRLPECDGHLTFKGGTSLSKAWKMIERFSEDIDIVVDRHLLGVDLDMPTMRSLTSRQRQRRADRLRKASRRWVDETLRPLLSERLEHTSGSQGLDVVIDPEAPDGDRLLVRYPSVCQSTHIDYLRREVKIELVARADDWPSEERSIVSYLSEILPEPDPGAAFWVRALVPERTFWEKAMLLHEETHRPGEMRSGAHLSRHYYDLWCLIRHGVAQRAAADLELFRNAAEHRQLFFPWTWMDYGTLIPGTLRIVPHPARVAAWEADYEVMRREMFFGEVPGFEEVLRVVGDFERQFNGAAGL